MVIKESKNSQYIYPYFNTLNPHFSFLFKLNINVADVWWSINIFSEIFQFKSNAKKKCWAIISEYNEKHRHYSRFWINFSIKWDEKKESIRFVGEQIPETACNTIVGEYNRMRWLLPILLVVQTNASHPAGWRRSQGNSLAPDTYFFTPSTAWVAVGINQEHISHWKVEKLRIYICTRHEGDNFLRFICRNALV